MGKTGDFGAKDNKETRNIYFFKTRVFSIWPGQKSSTKNIFEKGSFGAAQVENVVFRSGEGRKMGGGFCVAHTRTGP